MTAPTVGGNDKTRGELAHREVTATIPGEQGHTTIADVVVQKIAGLATREISGVYALGGGASRAFGALRERIPGASASSGQGVDVEVGERQAAADLTIVVEYGVAIGELAKAVRRNVIMAIERITGLEVVEVNIHVNDVHIPDEDEAAGPAEPARVL
ncbi:Asp23/Gls24 family envelope stress response protein [Amycolatopsis mongoliensis]|uniref:Asp23/Gls24 family envelope stress response protein n=2 Tax=Amycolatopsis mongoliensis TaxID=715475 RepID=A0A9Y2JIX6_9PSEU|nr:Asp23/Gls24 family envelope stress response protein [Amycolatopsis sp. 4-36]WIX98136.1 Asp23/Gls24 family envelope stress response protein [Amycolatopsis sp. 4-36]